RGGEIARTHAHLLREHHCEIRRPIAECGIARPLEHGLDTVGRAEGVRRPHELRTKRLGSGGHLSDFGLRGPLLPPAGPAFDSPGFDSDFVSLLDSDLDSDAFESLLLSEPLDEPSPPALPLADSPLRCAFLP